MEEHRNDRNMPDQNRQAEAETKAVVKKPYASPVLVEYGTIAKLTQGNKTRSRDNHNSRKRRCL
ncbi:MAG: lasso RiPP family leader peptide-containing protein [Burkholderiales bacterium]|jgi:hypothetical protein